MIQNKALANFACLSKRFNKIPFIFFFKGHNSHRKCIANYMKSENGKKSKYLCPMRCSDIYSI